MEKRTQPGDFVQACFRVGDATELETVAGGRLTDHLAKVLAARYAVALAGWNAEVTEEFRRRLRALRGLCQDIVELRRGDHSGARLQMERARLEREREKTEEEVVAQFDRWARNPQVRDWILQDRVSPEERAGRIREIFNLPPLPPEQAPASVPESNLVKPGQTKSSQVQTSEPLESAVGGLSAP